MKHRRRFILLVPGLLLLAGPVASTYGASFVQTYERTGDHPQTVTDTFIVADPDHDYTLLIENGGPDGARRAAGAVVTINGETVVGPADFRAQISQIERPVTLEVVNEIAVEVRGRPGSSITVTILAEDNTPPDLQFLTPTAGSAVEPRPAFNVTFSDGGSGIDPDSLRISVNGIDVTAQATTAPASAFYWPGTALPVGGNEASVQVADRAGNLRTATVRFTVVPFRAIADCSPTSGPAPLDVLFRSGGEFGGGSIERYRWDFQGDGAFDTDSDLALDYTHTFQTPGTFSAVLEVTNNLGETATDRCTIDVAGSPPVATADASPSNGPVPLDVQFTCTGSDPDGSIALYEWDFDGDGGIDHSDPDSGAAMHTYEEEGTFVARCRVTDNDDLTAEARATTTVIRPGPAGSPSVTATASPGSGTAPLTVTFGGSAIDDGTILLWEWDFDGDGKFDHSSPDSPFATFRYDEAGIFAATLRATDETGKTGTDTTEVVVALEAGLGIPDDTFEPLLGETATIETSLSAPARVRVLLRGPDGAVVRTLVDETRAAGTYEDVWDGTDEDGKPLPEAPYYAILEYEAGDGMHRIDLTNTTGGDRHYPSRPTLPTKFSPFDDELLPIEFTIPGSRGASEIEAFVGLRYTDTRFVTLLNQAPLGAGSYTIHWDGLDASGNVAVAPPGDAFLVGLIGTTLPDNAVFLKAAPVISGVTVDPNFFDPATPSFLSPAEPLAVVSYALDRPARMELTVTNLETGLTLRRVIQRNVEADTRNTITWDGHTDEGHFADAGDYRLSLQAIDAAGSRSIMRYALVRVFY